MAYFEKRRRNQQRYLTFIGILIIASMALSAIVPLVQNAQQQTIASTPVPEPTLETPPSAESILFDTPYLHPSGLFALRLPTGWTAAGDSTNIGEAQLTARNNAIRSVLDVRLIQPPAETTIATVEDLNQVFTDEWMSSTWTEYTSWTETRREIENDRLVMDFTLSKSNQSYIARQIGYIEDGKVISARVVTLPNASSLIVYLLDGIAPTITPIEVTSNAPVDWSSYFDKTTRHIIRFPSSWSVVDAADGAPASIEGTGVTLRVETVPTVISTEAEAEAFVEGLRAGITPLSVKAVERDGLKGFQVAYNITNLDGDTESGAVVLLNGTDEKLHVANLRLIGVPDADLNNESAVATYGDALNVLGSFTLLPNLDLLVAEATAEATVEATAEATAAQ